MLFHIKKLLFWDVRTNDNIYMQASGPPNVVYYTIYYLLGRPCVYILLYFLRMFNFHVFYIFM